MELMAVWMEVTEMLEARFEVVEETGRSGRSC
jgi:hypothetical protein